MTVASFKNARIVRSSWLETGGRRLDCNPYMSGALEAKELLSSLSVTKHLLQTLVTKNGLYKGKLLKRTYVNSKGKGVPFLTTSGMLESDLSRAPLIARLVAKKDIECIVSGPTILISAAGTIGKMVYAGKQMQGMFACSDILKIKINEEVIPSGYLYSFLSGRYGIPMVVAGTYGAIIQHLNVEHISDLPVPRFSDHKEKEVDAAIKLADELRWKASEKLNRSQELLQNALNIPNFLDKFTDNTERLVQVVNQSEVVRNKRLDGFFYNPLAKKIESWAKSFGANCFELGSVADVFDVSPFKHIYVEDGFGVPFYTSGELFDLNRKPTKFLSHAQTKNLKSYILQQDWVLLARSGQLGGIIGCPQYADSAMNGAAASDHVIRLVPKALPGGYLFAYLYNQKVGYPLLTRTMTGHSIPALWPSQLATLPIVAASNTTMQEISTLVVSAFEDRVRATDLEQQARKLVEDLIERGGTVD